METQKKFPVSRMLLILLSLVSMALAQTAAALVAGIPVACEKGDQQPRPGEIRYNIRCLFVHLLYPLRCSAGWWGW